MLTLSISNLCNYVTSIYRETLRSFAIYYNEVSTCSKSATETLKEDSEYVLRPKTERTTH